MKARQPVDDQGRPLGPFERPAAVWRELGAPPELYDVQGAAAAELVDQGGILEPGEAGYPGPLDFYARRWWRRHRPVFLADVGQLTPAERRIILARRGRS